MRLQKRGCELVLRDRHVNLTIRLSVIIVLVFFQCGRIGRNQDSIKLSELFIWSYTCVVAGCGSCKLVD